MSSCHPCSRRGSSWGFLARYGPGVTRRAGLSSRLVLVVGVAALAVGIVVLALAAAQPVSFGWFAYAPLSETTFTVQGVHVFSTASLVGAVIVVISLLVLAAWFGYRQGVRRKL